MPSVSHDNKTLPFKPGQILLAIYHSQTKLLQKSEMRKEIVIELSYKGFSRASDYS